MADRTITLSTDELEMLVLLAQDAAERGRFEFEPVRFAAIKHFLELHYALARREDAQLAEAR